MVRFEHGLAVFEATPGEGHQNPLFAVQGGWASIVVDSALGCAAHANVPAEKIYTALETRANLVRAVKARTVTRFCESRIIHLGGRTAAAEAKLIGRDCKR